jgi:hypothetical protein
VLAEQDVGSVSTSDRIVFSLDPLRNQWFENGFTEDEAIRWRTQHFSAQEADKWRSVTFPNPEKATPWFKLQIPPLLARTFIAEDVSLQKAALWFPNRDIPADQRLSVDAMICIASWVEAEIPCTPWVLRCIEVGVDYRDWVKTGEKTIGGGPSPEEIAGEVHYRWTKYGFLEAEKFSFREVGIMDGGDAYKWVTSFKKHNISPEPKDLREWVKLGFEPDEAALWCKAIQLGTELNRKGFLADNWRSQGWEPIDLYMLSDLTTQRWSAPTQKTVKSFPVELKNVYSQMFEAGIPRPNSWSVEEVAAVKPEEQHDKFTTMSIKEIAEWVSFGFKTPEAVLHWKSQNATPEIAAEICKKH